MSFSHADQQPPFASTSTTCRFNMGLQEENSTRINSRLNVQLSSAITLIRCTEETNTGPNKRAGGPLHYPRQKVSLVYLMQQVFEAKSAKDLRLSAWVTYLYLLPFATRRDHPEPRSYTSFVNT